MTLSLARTGTARSVVEIIDWLFLKIDISNLYMFITKIYIYFEGMIIDNKCKLSSAHNNLFSSNLTAFRHRNKHLYLVPVLACQSFQILLQKQ
jgi:hypothetical protein